MHTSFWSVKGGVGVSTTAALHALAVAGRARPTLLVDLVGDQPALLGVDDVSGPGILDWIADGARDATALDRIAVDVTSDLALVPAGSRAAHEPTATAVDGARISDALASRQRQVIVDCGRATDTVSAGLLASAGRRMLVLRACYLTLRAARAAAPEPHGIVLIREPGRALGVADVETVTGCPVVADIAFDPAIARAVDAGLIASRIPRGLRRTMERLGDDTA